MAMDPTFIQSATAVLAIVLGALISEDAATLGAASLASTHFLHPATAISAAAFGIWFGDLGLYALAFSLGPALTKRKWLAAKLTPQRLETVGGIASSWGGLALAASRFIPGTRLPATVISGFVKMPLRKFAIITAACSLVWVTAVFFAVIALRMRLGSPLRAVGLTGLILALFGLVVSRRNAIINSLRRYRRWEFWPAWLFYAPVAGMCVWLSFKYRGVALPALANLNQKHGGIIGESKSEILRELDAVAPGHVASTRLIIPGTVEERVSRSKQIAEELALKFPMVLKPDVGQRGAGFKVVNNWTEVQRYLESVATAVVIQQHVSGPYEAGIFYYRLPGTCRGEILALTDKIFPCVTGDGVQSLEQLIDADPRARLIAQVYKKRFADVLNEIVPDERPFRLVEAGNHCQGCIFRDGAHLNSPELAAKIDAISTSIPGFFIGRYDVRYENPEKLRAGKFTIIELNGAASEATNIYDEHTSLWQAYRVLYRQWDLVYQIGAMNRALTKMKSSALSVLKDWLAYQRTSLLYPRAD